MWGLFALRTRYHAQCRADGSQKNPLRTLRTLPLFIEGVPAERGRELRKKLLRRFAPPPL